MGSWVVGVLGSVDGADLNVINVDVAVVKGWRMSLLMGDHH